MLDREQILEIFKQSGALLEGHFRLTSGRHSDRYIQCAQVLKYPRQTEVLCMQLADNFQGIGAELVVGPAMGGILVAYEAGRHLGLPAIFTERKEGKMALRRGFTIIPGQKVLVVEDVVTTGGSVREVIQLVREHGGTVTAVGALVDRTAGTVDFGVPFYSLLALKVESYEPDECPLCRQGMALETPGSRVFTK